MSSKHLVYLFVLSIFAGGCAANLNNDNKVIAVVGNEPITYGEFKTQYAQNALPSGDSAESVSNKENFLNLLVEYNLKLLDAQKENLREEPAVRAEMENYETQLAVGYVLEHEITDPMVRTIYDRRKYEVRAEQVFIQIKPDSAFPMGDTLKAYDEAMSSIKALDDGAPIDSLIRLYRGGDTYYITAGNYLQYAGGEQFEDMLYSLKPGEVGQTPIRTPYGYLIVKLTDKRPRVESVRASHILIRMQGNTPADTLKAYDEAVAVLDSAKAGVDFAKLAMEYSADSVSARRGGDLGYFSRGMMVRPFDEEAFDLKPGEIGGPVRSQFGYHIIKVTGVKDVPPFSQVREELRSKYLDGGYKIDLEKFVENLKRKYDYRLSEKGVNSFIAKLDPSKDFGRTDFDSVLTSEELKDTLFTFDNEAGTVDTVLYLARQSDKFNNYGMNATTVNTMITEASKELVLDHYAMQKASTYPAFDSLITKYENGILIYQIEQQKVWSRVASSDSVLKPYFMSHAEKYVWPKRVDLSRIEVRTATLADSIYDLLSKGANFDTLAARYDKVQGMEGKSGHWGVFADSTNSLAVLAFNDMKPGDYSKPRYFEGGYVIIRVDDFVAPGPMTFDEARAQVSADYQEYESKRLQSEWMQHLREEFGVKIDEKTFHELLAKD